MATTSGGASSQVYGSFDEDPMCVQTGMPASAQAANTGSQYRRRSCTDGSPSAAGFSEKVTARAPFAAQRSTSATRERRRPTAAG